MFKQFLTSWTKLRRKISGEGWQSLSFSKDVGRGSSCFVLEPVVALWGKMRREEQVLREALSVRNKTKGIKKCPELIFLPNVITLAHHVLTDKKCVLSRTNPCRTTLRSCLAPRISPLPPSPRGQLVLQWRYKFCLVWEKLFSLTFTGWPGDTFNQMCL